MPSFCLLSQIKLIPFAHFLSGLSPRLSFYGLIMVFELRKVGDDVDATPLYLCCEITSEIKSARPGSNKTTAAATAAAFPTAVDCDKISVRTFS